MDADTQATAPPLCRHASGLHRMIELIDACCDPLHKMASGFGQSDTPRMVLKEEDSEVVLQSFHACADARLAYSEGTRSMAEVQVFGDGKRLNERRERNAPT